MLNDKKICEKLHANVQLFPFWHPFIDAGCSLTVHQTPRKVVMNMDRLKSCRAAFCRWYLALGNVREAALRAGCPPETAADDGLKMLHSAYCRRYLSQLAAQPALPLQGLVTAGLARLAFGDANDAAKLVFAEKITPDELRALDLFHVTGIKLDKNGIEIKLADRLSAMTKLLECAGAADSAAAAAALMQALQGGQTEEVDALDSGDACDAGAVFTETA